MKIRIICVGKIKEAYLKEGINEYLKRIKPYAQIEIVELPDEAICENPKSSEIEKVKNNEGNKILKLVKNGDYLVNLDLNQKMPNSVQFATFLQDKLEKSGAYLTFAIGGSYGLSDEVKARANDAISLSNLTFLHQMTRLILLEQIYRAFRLIITRFTTNDF